MHVLPIFYFEFIFCSIIRNKYSTQKHLKRVLLSYINEETAHKAFLGSLSPCISFYSLPSILSPSPNSTNLTENKNQQYQNP